jgi:hypothetical protein
MSEGGILSEELVSVDGERDGTSDNLPPSFIVLALAVGNAVQEAGCVGVGALLQRRRAAAQPSEQAGMTLPVNSLAVFLPSADSILGVVVRRRMEGRKNGRKSCLHHFRHWKGAGDSSETLRQRKLLLESVKKEESEEPIDCRHGIWPGACFASLRWKRDSVSLLPSTNDKGWTFVALHMTAFA